MPPPDTQQIHSHQKSVAQWPYLAVFPVMPVDANFSNRKPETVGKMEDFDVIGEAVHCRSPEQQDSGSRREALETTLGIGNARERPGSG